MRHSNFPLRLDDINQTLPIIYRNVINEDDIQKILDSVDFSKMYRDSGNVDSSDEKGFNRKTFEIIKDDYLRDVEKKILYYSYLANYYYAFDIESINEFKYMEYYLSDKGLKWHNDIERKPPYNLRKLSFSIGLNHQKEYKGGKIKFFIDEDNILTYTLSKGDLIFFPSFMIHKISCIEEGTRIALVGFMWGEPYK
jgi:predicted 2-oxoglutarate/Fe(II)-dependent dioxygenase YbiX